MTVINLFGGPGVGKSTIATELFTIMKKKNFKVELVTEFAKDLTYADDRTRLRDQLLILAEQNHRLFRLKNNVDYAITDSPLLMAIAYNKTIDPSIFNPFVKEIFKSYKNLNFFIKRNDSYFQEYGRYHTLYESKKIDTEILKILEEFNFQKIHSIDSIKEYLNII